ncbi:uncharacterized protein F10E9.5-like [Pogonomyrmex barbatus]|uniref:Uncharacterized protein F10E9.5-like n=1 Tax=Pogonomyrmex barbatus TaxID=144034 RepID=A0A6I9W669_9HYME|nr:uncharacterized protein F10E9.5-like [Pogonomyrmex barbatus]
MEFAAAKRHGKWRRKRYLRKRLRERIKIEVKSKHWRVFPKYDTRDTRETLTTDTMQADAFWKNYTVAQEWQKRHNITWWRSRCVALEHENKILRDKVRFLAQRRDYRDNRQNNHNVKANNDSDARRGNHVEFVSNDEDFEFTITEDMLNFFETSERHKRELRQKRRFKAAHEKKVSPRVSEEETPIVGGAESIQRRKKEADLLYGEASSKILAMEASLQSKVNQYEDTNNPQYWPNIPLNF